MSEFLAANWFYIVVAGISIGALYRLLFPSRAIRLVLHDAGIDVDTASAMRGTSGTWNGRDVALSIDAPTHGLPRRAVVRVAAVTPSRFRVRHIDSADIYWGGPGRIDCPLARKNMAIWADEPGLTQRLFSDLQIAQQLSITIAAKGDSVEFNADSLRVELATTRFESEYTALFAAWRAATELTVLMSLGLPPDGHFPLIEIRDSVWGTDD